MQIEPWKKVGPEQVLAESYGRSLITQKYLDPNTNEAREYSRFSGKNFSCIILAVTTENKVLAVRQYRPAIEEVTLELPGGSQKYQGQTPESVAREELAEETSGYEPGGIIPLLKEGCWFEASSVDIVYYPYLFTGCRKTNGQANADEGEYIELIHIPLPEWITMCDTGQIRDSKSIVVTALAKKYLAQKET